MTPSSVQCLLLRITAALGLTVVNMPPKTLFDIGRSASWSPNPGNIFGEKALITMSINGTIPSWVSASIRVRHVGTGWNFGGDFPLDLSDLYTKGLYCFPPSSEYSLGQVCFYDHYIISTVDPLNPEVISSFAGSYARVEIGSLQAPYILAKRFVPGSVDDQYVGGLILNLANTSDVRETTLLASNPYTNDPYRAFINLGDNHDVTLYIQYIRNSSGCYNAALKSFPASPELLYIWQDYYCDACENCRFEFQGETRILLWSDTISLIAVLELGPDIHSTPPIPIYRSPCNTTLPSSLSHHYWGFYGGGPYQVNVILPGLRIFYFLDGLYISGLRIENETCSHVVSHGYSQIGAVTDMSVWKRLVATTHVVNDGGFLVIYQVTEAGLVQVGVPIQTPDVGLASQIIGILTLSLQGSILLVSQMSYGQSEVSKNELFDYAWSGTPTSTDVGVYTVDIHAVDRFGHSEANLTTVIEIANFPRAAAKIRAMLVPTNQATTFYISASTFEDPSPDQLTYAATLTSGASLPPWINFGDKSLAFTVNPATADAGIYSIRVIATAGEYGSAFVDFPLRVDNYPVPISTIPGLAVPIDRPGFPVFNISAAKYFFDADGSENLSLDASTPGGGSLPVFLSSSVAGGVLTLTSDAKSIHAGLYSARISCTDPWGASTHLDASLTVEHFPVTGVISTHIVVAGIGFPFNYALPTGFCFDADNGDILQVTADTLSGNPLPNWLGFSSSLLEFSGTPGLRDNGTVIIRVTCTDLAATSASSSFLLRVKNLPKLLRTPPPIVLNMQASNRGVSVALDGAAWFLPADPNDQLTFSLTLATGLSLPSWLAFNNSTVTVLMPGAPRSPADPGLAPVPPFSLDLVLAAADPLGGVSSSPVTLYVSSFPVLGRPLPDAVAGIGLAFTFQIPAGTFVSQTPVALSFSGNGASLPSWMIVDAVAGTVIGTPQPTDAGTHLVNVTATNSFRGAIQTSFFIKVGWFPVVRGTLPSARARVSSTFSLAVPSLLFFDADSPNLTLAATPNSGKMSTDANSSAETSLVFPWLFFSRSNSSFTGFPREADVGQYQVFVWASDGVSPPVAAPLFLTVFLNQAPRAVKPIQDEETPFGKILRFSISPDVFEDPDGDVLIYTTTLKNGDPLPPWILFNPAFQSFEIRPSKHQAATYRSAVYPLVFTAIDGDGAAASVTFAVVVTGASYLQTAILAISVAASIAGTLLTAWKKRMFLWNHVIGRHKFTTAEHHVISGDCFSYTLTGFDGHAFGKMQIEYHREEFPVVFLPRLELPLKQVKRVTMEKSWLSYDPGSQIVSGVAGEQGIYTVTIVLRSSKIQERFEIHVHFAVEEVIPLSISTGDETARTESFTAMSEKPANPSDIAPDSEQGSLEQSSENSVVDEESTITHGEFTTIGVDVATQKTDCVESQRNGSAS